MVVPELAGECHAPRELDEAIASLDEERPRQDERFLPSAGASSSRPRPRQAPRVGAGRRRRARGARAAIRRPLGMRGSPSGPHEPGRSRAEFARLLRDARATLEASGVKCSTPSAGPVSEALAARMAPSDPAQLAGTPYRLGAKIGEGASGVVYEAEHVELGRKVAVKVLGREHAASAEGLDRFRAEARAVAGLSHPEPRAALRTPTASRSTLARVPRHGPSARGRRSTPGSGADRSPGRRPRASRSRRRGPSRPRTPRAWSTAI